MALSARLHCGITEFKRESDSDIHLILFDAGTYGVAEMPAAACVPKKPRARKAIINARKKFEAACGKQPTPGSNLAQSSRSAVSASGTSYTHKPLTPELHGATPCLGDQVHSRLPRLEPPRLRGPIELGRSAHCVGRCVCASLWLRCLTRPRLMSTVWGRLSPQSSDSQTRHWSERTLTRTSPRGYVRFETSRLTLYGRPSAATANQDSLGRRRRALTSLRNGRLGLRFSPTRASDQRGTRSPVRLSRFNASTRARDAACQCAKRASYASSSLSVQLG
jgi:hypothetical protein